MDRLDISLKCNYKNAVTYAERAMVNNAIEHEFSEGTFNATFKYEDCINFVEKSEDDVITITIRFEPEEKDFYLQHISNFWYDAYMEFSRNTISISWSSQQDALNFLNNFKKYLA